MAKIKTEPKVEMEVTLDMTETEARALYALTEYGVDGFLKVFYREMGESALKPHEAGLKSLFAAAKSILPMYFKRADKARAAFKDKSK